LKHSFPDKYSELSSLVHSFDSRLKIIFIFLAIIIIVSEKNGDLLNLGFYSIIITIFVFLSRVPIIYFLKRLAVVLPFLVFAALFYPLSFVFESKGVDSRAVYGGLSILIKSTLSVLLLLTLVSTVKFTILLSSLRSIGMPKIVCIIAALMYRYVFILWDEALRTTIARQSRTPGQLKQNKLKVLSNQYAMVFIRSWERSKIVYNAMLSRGFSGNFSFVRINPINFLDIFVFVFISALFVFLRFSKNILPLFN
jgi:cobalt/nickel transport system permease protein